MDRVLNGRLRRLERLPEAQLLRSSKKGIEKESLRVTRDGEIARTPHPRALGAALTHPFITMDYSEALIELVTPPFGSVAETLGFLTDIHRFVTARLGDEVLWATSMPCTVSQPDDVPIADFGNSNVGRMKRVYRVGLGHRYGRAMQAIAGVHFNFSMHEALWPILRDLDAAGGDGALQDYVSASYFALLRNFRRCAWLVLYLFGASPAICKSFLGGKGAAGLERWGKGTLYGRYATSLRMSDIGYHNSVQARLDVPVNNLGEYIAGLSAATATPWPAYQQIGVRVDGEYRQLNANILQIENEFYSVMRPKRVASSGERPTQALRRGGVEYVEMRALDVSVFDPVGVNEPQLLLLEILLLRCLLCDSPAISSEEQDEIDRNIALTARAGREPDLKLRRDGRDVALSDWTQELLQEMQAVAALLDAGQTAATYANALTAHADALGDPAATASARVLDDMAAHGESFFAFAMRHSLAQHSTLRAMGPPAGERGYLLEKQVLDSLARQLTIEAADDIGFDEYLEKYFAQ